MTYEIDNGPEIGCKDCKEEIDPFEIYSCDTDCKISPLCETCYNENHAEGGCKE